MNSSSPFSAHSDILDQSVTDDNRQSLANECQERAKAALQAGALPDAVRLYQKAIECVTTDQNRRALLHANLSLAHGKMNQWKEACTAAQAAVDADAMYAKGWWRLGQAQAKLDDVETAIASLKKGQGVEPENKAFAKEIAKLEAMPKKGPPPKPKTEPAEPLGSVKKVIKKEPKTATSKTEPMDIDDDTGNIFTKSDHVKGYKIVNGKKTSFFHNELSEDAKRLIGDIQPKPIDASAAMPTTTTNAGTSAWNTAGTWEERNVSEVACRALKERLLSICSEVTVEGTASVVQVRGKKRFLYEMTKCTMEMDDGKLVLDVIDASCPVGDPYDVLECTVSADQQAQVFACIDAWATEFPVPYFEGKV